MLKKIRNIISLSMVILFITPLTIKFVDELFHHHYHYFIEDKSVNHFHQYYEKCPISNFEFSIFSIKKYFYLKQKNLCSIEQNEVYDFVCCCNNIKYSFLLRAPPKYSE